MNLLKILSRKVKMDSRKVKSFAEKISPLKKAHKVASDIGSPTNFKHVVHIGTDSSHADVSEVPKKVNYFVYYFYIYYRYLLASMLLLCNYVACNYVITLHNSFHES